MLSATSSQNQYTTHRFKDRHCCDGRSNTGAKNQEVQEEKEVWAQLDLLVRVPYNLFQGLHAGAHRPEDAVEADQSIEEEHSTCDEHHNGVECGRMAGAFVHFPVDVAIHVRLRKADTIGLSYELPGQESKTPKAEDSFNNLNIGVLVLCLSSPRAESARAVMTD